VRFGVITPAGQPFFGVLRRVFQRIIVDGSLRLLRHGNNRDQAEEHRAGFHFLNSIPGLMLRQSKNYVRPVREAPPAFKWERGHRIAGVGARSTSSRSSSRVEEKFFRAYEPSVIACVIEHMRLPARAVFVSILGALGVASNSAQTPVPHATPTSFDVVSIKPNQTGSEARRAGSSPGGMFTATNVSLRLLISRAFGVAEFQVERGPGWVDSEKYILRPKRIRHLR
jgi:hypothetical protein